MSHTPAEVDFIEHIAQEQFKYLTIFEEHARVLRADIPQLQAAVMKFQQTPLVAKFGQRWQPTQDNVDEYLARCNDMCNIKPQDIDDRVKILHAAHAAIMCLVICKYGPQPDRVQCAISKRNNELLVAAYGGTPSSATPMTKPCEPPLTKPTVDPRRPTIEELQSFQNPENLHGKFFILAPDRDESGMYEVIGYSRLRDKSVQYSVLFDDCPDPIIVSTAEMLRMLEDSVYLPV